jgi:ADP-ribose pyrophosphatase
MPSINRSPSPARKARAAARSSHSSHSSQVAAKAIRSEKSAGKSAAPIAGKAGGKGAKVQLVSSKLAYRGPLFDVYTDYVREPEGGDSRRDVIRHSGSVVILAVDASRNAKDPLVLLERQYRHAAGQYMWEIPAGRKEPEERPLPGAKRELLEETGYRAKRWTKMVRYYASPGFLGEWMQIYLAEGLSAGQAQPDDDEYIECIQIPLSQAVRWIESGKIMDGKSIIAILLYEHLRRTKKM